MSLKPKSLKSMPGPPPKGRTALGAALLFLGLAGAVFASTDPSNGPYNGFLAPGSSGPILIGDFGQAASLNDGLDNSPHLSDGAFQQAMAGTAWAVKFRLKTTAKGDYLTRTPATVGAAGATGQLLIGANRTSGKARAVLYPSGSAPVTIDGGLGANVADGQWHWIEVDCSGANAYVYTDGVLAGSATGGTAWSGAGAACDPRAGTTSSVSGNAVTCTIDELGIYSAALNTGTASFPSYPYVIANNAPHQVCLYHFDGNLLDSNTNTAL